MDDLDPDRSAWTAARAGYALLYIDLDGFKAVNDTCGHDVGDDVLREAARRIKAAAPALARAYRIGGDEFAVVVPNCAGLSDIREIGTQIVKPP